VKQPVSDIWLYDEKNETCGDVTSGKIAGAAEIKK
jgi:hypothetical protein